MQSSNKIRSYFGIVRGKQRLEGVFPLPVQTSLHRKPASELFCVAPLTDSESKIAFYSVALLANVEATKSGMWILDLNMQWWPRKGPSLFKQAKDDSWWEKHL